MRFPHHPTAVTLVTLLATPFVMSNLQAPCYWPDGSLAPHALPCSLSASASMCCEPPLQPANYPSAFTGPICLSQGICMYPSDSLPAEYRRGACTDRTYTSSLCLYFEPTEAQSLLVRQCDSGGWCATGESGGPNCCADGGMPIAAMRKDVQWPAGTTYGPAVLLTSQTANSGSSPTGSSASSTPTPKGNTGALIGLGVALGLVSAALIAAVTWFVVQGRRDRLWAYQPGMGRRKRKSTLNGMERLNSGGNSVGGGTLLTAENLAAANEERDQKGIFLEIPDAGKKKKGWRRG